MPNPMLVGERGTNKSHWPTWKHGIYWLTVSPGSKTTGGRKPG